MRLTGGAKPAFTLLGPDTTLVLRAGMHGQDVTLRLLSVQGQFVTLDATGSVTGGVADLSPGLTLSDVSKLALQLQGTLQARGRLHGPADNLAADIDLQGDLATQGLQRAPVTAALHLRGLPGAPTGEVTAQGTLDGSSLDLAATAERAPDGTLHADIGKADWKSAHAEGALTLAPGADLPQGKVSLRMTRLQDLDRLIGQSLAGSVEASAELDEQARIRARAQARGVMSIDTATLEAEGKQDALALRLTGTGMGAQASAAGTLNAPGKVLTLSALAATWKGERLALQAPARISFADGVTIDRMALGLRQAVLEVRGRVSPTLDATANLRNLPADLASVAVPGLAMDGSVNAQATLTGTTQLPGGRISVTATGLHLREGPGAAFPPGRLTATATLAGSSARVEAQANVGSAQASISGTAPLDASGPLNLQVRGNLDLAVLDPILTAEGRRARGRVVVDGGISGAPSAPSVTGTLALTGGEFQDASQGVRLRTMQALLRGSGNSISIERFNATAGAGTISATGSLGLASPMPLDLRLTARNATPIASDLLRATFDADIAVTGALQGALAVAGKLLIRNADIRVPERLPASVAVLNVRRPGERPKPPPAPSEISAPVALDLQVDAPGQIFVRGRGLDAELAGSLHVGGTSDAPRVDGGLHLRRGQFSLAGQTLNFSSGSVGLSGGAKIDPTLDFTATTTSGGVTATLHVRGTASMPKITLSSVPDLPQDEILSRLLFNQSTSRLGPFQIAQMAAGLAEIAGVGSGQQPLNRLRQALGLDRLSVGGSSNGQGASLEAGRYVSPGVYLGAKQSTTGSGTQATVQVDLWRGLKLEADVGTSGGQTAAGSTDTGGSSVGLTWQFEY